MGDGFDIERICRLNGKQPTARDRWTAFYRLYRMTQGHGHRKDMAAVDCFRVLFRGWAWIRLAEKRGSEDELLYARTIRRIPDLWKIVRRCETKKRLYGDNFEDIEEWLPQDQFVANHLRETQGIELTPEQVAENRKNIVYKIRQSCAERGVELPANDDELWELIRKSRHTE